MAQFGRKLLTGTAALPVQSFHFLLTGFPAARVPAAAVILGSVLLRPAHLATESVVACWHRVDPVCAILFPVLKRGGSDCLW